MICPKCKEMGQKSTIACLGGTVTCAYYQPYYDEEGAYHHHDGNMRNYNYSCSNGHRITVNSTAKCSSCSWGVDNEIIVVRNEENIVLGISDMVITKND